MNIRWKSSRDTAASPREEENYTLPAGERPARMPEAQHALPIDEEDQWYDSSSEGSSQESDGWTDLIEQFNNRRRKMVESRREEEISARPLAARAENPGDGQVAGASGDYGVQRRIDWYEENIDEETIDDEAVDEEKMIDEEITRQMDEVEEQAKAEEAAAFSPTSQSTKACDERAAELNKSDERKVCFVNFLKEVATKISDELFTEGDNDSHVKKRGIKFYADLIKNFCDQLVLEEERERAQLAKPGDLKALTLSTREKLEQRLNYLVQQEIETCVNEQKELEEARKVRVSEICRAKLREHARVRKAQRNKRIQMILDSEEELYVKEAEAMFQAVLERRYGRPDEIKELTDALLVVHKSVIRQEEEESEQKERAAQVKETLPAGGASGPSPLARNSSIGAQAIPAARATSEQEPPQEATRTGEEQKKRDSEDIKELILSNCFPTSSKSTSSSDSGASAVRGGVTRVEQPNDSPLARTDKKVPQETIRMTEEQKKRCSTETKEFFLTKWYTKPSQPASSIESRASLVKGARTRVELDDSPLAEAKKKIPQEETRTGEEQTKRGSRDKKKIAMSSWFPGDSRSASSSSESGDSIVKAVRTRVELNDSPLAETKKKVPQEATRMGEEQKKRGSADMKELLMSSWFPGDSQSAIPSTSGSSVARSTVTGVELDDSLVAETKKKIRTGKEQKKRDAADSKVFLTNWFPTSTRLASSSESGAYAARGARPKVEQGYSPILGTKKKIAGGPVVFNIRRKSSEKLVPEAAASNNFQTFCFGRM